jgi:sulfite oxidase
VYTRAQVAEHKSVAHGGVWVTFGDGVYDVTSFVAKHPGGDKILLAAGGAVDPYWVVYQQHATPATRAILESMRIGYLDPADVRASATAAAAVGDPYAADPPRHPALVAHALKPFNAETPAALLADAYLTPNELFFVRNHLPVPVVDEAAYMLEVDAGAGRPPLRLTLAQLKARFPRHTVTAALQCAGNRRNHMNRAKPSRGLAWDVGAMGNAEWAGARLSDVLAAAGADVGGLAAGGQGHVQFIGLDRDPASGVAYAASVPADIATAPAREAILAYEMNGAPLPRDHGFPVRAVVPGVVGARQVKWVGRVAVAAAEADSLWQLKDYKAFAPGVDWDNVDFDAAPAIQDMPVQSAICEPRDGAMLPAGATAITAKGFAWAGGGRGIARVEVSPDGGSTWHAADIVARPPDATAGGTRSWGWTLWQAEVPVPAGAAALDLRVKATDTAYNCQPEGGAPIWNYRGLVHNAWHAVRVGVAAAAPDGGGGGTPVA